MSWLSRLNPRRQGSSAPPGAIAFLVADKLNGKRYVDLQIFDRDAPTRIAQGLYDPAKLKVLDFRLVVSKNPVVDRELIKLVEEGFGVVFFPPSFYFTGSEN